MIGRLALAAARAAASTPGARSHALNAARSFSTAEKSGGGGFGKLLFVGAAAAGGVYAYQNGLLAGITGGPGPVISSGAQRDFGAVKKAVEDLLDKDDYDDGSYGPVLVRLAWHSAGTYDKASGTGGSNGATMRFTPESEHGANAGLHVARALLEPVKAKFPWISYADLYTLAGVTAIEAMGGPTIPWKPGRTDAAGSEACPPDGRLPDASLGAAHIREVFSRMGFNDREIVALSGAHTLGRCHKDRSGFDGPWTNAPTTFSNLYFKELTENKWRKKRWSGPLQYEDKSGTLMMLPTDMALVWDRKFRPVVEEYAKDEDAFFKDFASAFGKLMALGVPGQSP